MNANFGGRFLMLAGVEANILVDGSLDLGPEELRAIDVVVAADWDAVFAAAAESGVAIEIDGDPARQDLDFETARRALDAGCVFAGAQDHTRDSVRESPEREGFSVRRDEGDSTIYVRDPDGHVVQLEARGFTA